MDLGTHYATAELLEENYQLSAQRTDDLFSDKKLLVPEFLPSEDRIVGREREINTLSKTLREAALGYPMDNTFIYGPPGTGKSLVTRHVCRRIRESVVGDNDIGFASVNTREKRTSSSLLSTIARQLNKERETGITIPASGIGVDKYYQKLSNIVDRRHPIIILLLDSVSRIEPEELAPVIRLEDQLPVPVGIILIYDRGEIPVSIKEYCGQSVMRKTIEFDQYSRDQLRQILRLRTAAFDSGVLNDGVVDAVLDLDVVTDAHTAITALRIAGECAVRNGDGQVKTDHVHEARRPVSERLVYEQIRFVPKHAKMALYALAELMLNSSEDHFRTREVHDRYEELCKQWSIDPVSSRYLRELLKSRNLRDVVDYEKVNRGVSGGVYLNMELCVDPEVVESVLFGDLSK